ncbi:general amino acid permease [Scheffersomyces xylosifermentans]|uniref:general amino acid permease n=1 Tax=Scheffersomyces xylosifermentans TaxID=1304137 RepID=UPI00315C9CB2
MARGQTHIIENKTDLKKGLKKRQLQMIALGGCVGSGLLVASGLALRNGPGSLLVAWTIVSSFLYCTMQSLAELAAVFPVSGSFATYATRFIDPSWGFAMGWNYAIFWVIVLPLELVASSMTINFWNSPINSVVWVAIFYVLIIVLNLCGNKGFGETEFVAAIIKLLGIVGFNILAVILICGGGDQGYIGGKYWHNPGAFTTGFKGVISVLITATYSLAGTELIGLTSAESEENPRVALPKAIKQVFWRIIIFYMLTLTLVGFLVPATSDELIGASSNSSNSPFVIAIRAGGIKVLPSIFNVIVLVALLSIGNSAVYGFSRTVLALAEQGLAPKFFMYVDRKGRPLAGILVAAIVSLLAFVSASPQQSAVFAWLVSLSGLSTLFTWGSINASFIRFRAALSHQGRTTEELPYVSNTGIWGAYYGLIMNFLVLAFQFWLSLFPLGKKPNAKDFFENYLGSVIVIVFYVGHKVYSRNFKLLVNVEEIEIDTGRSKADIDLLQQEISEEKERAKSLPVYRKIFNFWC